MRQLLLGIGAVGFGLSGTCFVLLGGGMAVVPDVGVSSTNISQWGPVVGGGMVAVGLAAACIWGIIRLNKHPK